MVKNSISAGCIVIHKKRKETYVLLIHKTWSEDNNGWVPPKGTVQGKESLEQAAIRETREETGIVDVKIICKLGQSSFEFTRNNMRIHKSVHWFLAKSLDGKLSKTKLSDNEQKTEDDVRWFELDEAIKIVKFDNDREILKRAKSLFC